MITAIPLRSGPSLFGSTFPPTAKKLPGSPPARYYGWIYDEQPGNLENLLLFPYSRERRS